MGFSFDEKSQIQALDRTQPGLPMKQGRAGTMTHDYKRYGTTTLFAALDVATGTILPQCMPKHRHQEFHVFLKRMERSVPNELAIHVILDHYATHKHPKVKEWLAKNTRVHFHFTPTSWSWLNLVERCFGELTERQRRRLAITSVAQLITAITDDIDRRNAQPTRFVWTATVRQILNNVGRANATLATLHEDVRVGSNTAKDMTRGGDFIVHTLKQVIDTGSLRSVRACCTWCLD